MVGLKPTFLDFQFCVLSTHKNCGALLFFPFIFPPSSSMSLLWIFLLSLMNYSLAIRLRQVRTYFLMQARGKRKVCMCVGGCLLKIKGGSVEERDQWVGGRECWGVIVAVLYCYIAYCTHVWVCNNSHQYVQLECINKKMGGKTLLERTWSIFLKRYFQKCFHWNSTPLSKVFVQNNLLKSNLHHHSSTLLLFIWSLSLQSIFTYIILFSAHKTLWLTHSKWYSFTS